MGGRRGVHGLALPAALLALLALALPPAGATVAAQVSPAGAWRTLETAHFRIHHRPDARPLAERAAGEAERAYDLLARELRPPRGRVDLVLSDAADFPNAFASVFPTNRIVVLVAPPTAEPGLQRYDDWLRLVLVHELAHVFHLDRVRGPWALVQKVLGRVPGTFPAAYQPAWVIEGLATYYESRLTAGGRVRGSFHRQVLLAAERGGEWLEPNETAFLFEKWPDGIAPYAFGGRFFERLSLAAGDSAVPRYVETTAGQWIPYRTARPLRRATGLRRDSVWADMRSEVAACAGPDDPDADLIERRLRAPAAPAVSPDGALAYHALRGDRPGEIVVRRPGADPARHLSTAGVDLAWRGDTLYAVRLEFADPVTFRSDLHRLVSGRWERLTRGARLTELAAATDGVYGVQIHEGSNRPVRWTGTGLSPVRDARAGVEWASPALSGSGRLAIVVHEAGRYRIEVVGGRDPGASSAGSYAAIEGGPGEVLADPAWSPDGEWLVWTSDAGGLPQVYGRRGADGPVRRLTALPTGAMQPALGPDGWLYVVTLESDGYAVRRIPWKRALAAGTDEPGPVAVAGGAACEGTTSAAAPAEEAPPAPPAVSASTGYDPWPALRPRYLVPYAIDRRAAGVFVGAVTSGRDPIERTRYHLELALGLEGPRVAGELALVHQRWAHAALDLFLSQEWSDAGAVSTPFPAELRSRQRDAALGLTVGWRRWRRSLSLRVAAEYEEDRFASEPGGLEFAAPEFAGASLSVSAGRSVATPLGVSAEDGLVISGRYRRRWRLDQPGWSNEWRGRVAGYLGIRGVGGFARPVLAGRATGAWSAGPSRRTFGLGGAGGASFEIAPGIVAGDPRDFPVRGYPGGELRGDRVLAASVELRVPVALVAEPLGDLPLGFDRASLSVFYDYGTAWALGRSAPSGSLQSLGVEAVWDLGVSYEVPLRLRTFLALPLRSSVSTTRGRLAAGVGFGADF